MPGKMFVNYRRDDAAASAARLRDRLATAFGAASVFMDVDSLLIGQRFNRELEKAVTETDVFHAVIGPQWMGLLQGKRASRPTLTAFRLVLRKPRNLTLLRYDRVRSCILRVIVAAMATGHDVIR